MLTPELEELYSNDHTEHRKFLKLSAAFSAPEGVRIDVFGVKSFTMTLSMDYSKMYSLLCLGRCEFDASKAMRLESFAQILLLFLYHRSIPYDSHISRLRELVFEQPCEIFPCIFGWRRSLLQGCLAAKVSRIPTACWQIRTERHIIVSK